MDALRARFHSPPIESARRVLENLALPEPLKKPLAAIFYLTFQCNANCGGCSQEAFVRGNGRAPSADLALAKRVLGELRTDVPNIYITGGEPTVSPYFEAVLKECTELGFESIGFNTNAVRFRPEVFEHVDLLTVSLHSVDPARLAGFVGVDEETANTILENISHYARHRNPDKTMVTANCLVRGDNIGDAFEVARFCEDLGIRFNVAPMILSDGQPDPRLKGNREYQGLIDWLSDQNDLRSASHKYYQTIRDFDAFECTPQVIPTVYANGDVMPCEHLSGEARVNMLEVGGLQRALGEGRSRLNGFNPSQCANNCHKLCYVEGAAINTLSGLMDRVRQEILSKMWH